MDGWVPQSAFTLGNGVSGACGDQLHVLVADFIKSFDTIDWPILDCELGRLGLLLWLRKVYLLNHSQVRLRLKFAAGLGTLGAGTGGFSWGVFFFKKKMLLCTSLGVGDAILVGPQLYADNL